MNVRARRRAARVHIVSGRLTWVSKSPSGSPASNREYSVPEIANWSLTGICYVKIVLGNLGGKLRVTDVRKQLQGLALQAPVSSWLPALWFHHSSFFVAWKYSFGSNLIIWQCVIRIYFPDFQKRIKLALWFFDASRLWFWYDDNQWEDTNQDSHEGGWAHLIEPRTKA